MGDDLPDIVLLKKAGISACPADAVTEVLQLARYISPFNGGKGCVRDVIEKTMRLQSTWPVLYLKAIHFMLFKCNPNW